MTTLTIKPLEYKGRRLQELGDKVVASVYPLMDDFRTLRETSLRTLLRNERQYLSELVKWHQVRLTPPYNLAFSQQIGEFLSQYGENVLGVTQLPATLSVGELLVHVGPELDSWIQSGFCIEGRAPNGTQTAYVSAYRSQYGDLDSQTHFERLLKISTHEVGHRLGLSHHRKKKQETRNGRLCLMSSNNENIQQTDYIFCDRCYDTLGISAPQIRA